MKREDLIPYALGAAGVVLVGEYVGVVAPSLALLVILAVVVVMSMTRKREHRARRGWSLAGSVLAAIAAIGGLAMLAIAVVLFVALSSGNFKLGNK